MFPASSVKDHSPEAATGELAGEGSPVAKIAAEKQAIETAKTEWHGLEAKKKTLENEIKAGEEKVAAFSASWNRTSC